MAFIKYQHIERWGTDETAGIEIGQAKVYSKIVNECGVWSSKYIPRLLNTVYHDVVYEECWNFVKKYKNPTIDFTLLNGLIIAKIKKELSRVFT